jgi:hypothetical protein
MNSRTLAAAIVAACATVLAGCVTTSMQGYADLDRPARPIEHVAVVAPPALLAALATEAAKHGLVVEDSNVIVPPTRQYKDAEIRQLLKMQGIDGVLVVSVTGDTGVQERYAGTILSANYSYGAMTAAATPTYRYSRTVAFQARLSDPNSGRNLWVGKGQTQAGGALFMADATSALDAASTILKDLQGKGLIGNSGA